MPVWLGRQRGSTGCSGIQAAIASSLAPQYAFQYPSVVDVEK